MLLEIYKKHLDGDTVLEAAQNMNTIIHELASVTETEEEVLKDPFLRRLTSRYIYNLFLWVMYIKKNPEEDLTDQILEVVEKKLGLFSDDQMSDCLNKKFAQAFESSYTEVGRFEMADLRKKYPSLQELKTYFIKRAFRTMNGA